MTRLDKARARRAEQRKIHGFPKKRSIKSGTPRLDTARQNRVDVERPVNTASWNAESLAKAREAMNSRREFSFGLQNFMQ